MDERFGGITGKGAKSRAKTTVSGCMTDALSAPVMHPTALMVCTETLRLEAVTLNQAQNAQSTIRRGRPSAWARRNRGWARWPGGCGPLVFRQHQWVAVAVLKAEVIPSERFAGDGEAPEASIIGVAMPPCSPRHALRAAAETSGVSFVLQPPYRDRTLVRVRILPKHTLFPRLARSPVEDHQVP